MRRSRLTTSRLARFRAEAEILGRLRHPGIAQILEAGTYSSPQGPQPFLVMEPSRISCAADGAPGRATGRRRPYSAIRT